MDKPQEEMQELGFLGIYKETFKTILEWKKIFTQITLSFILPLSFIFILHYVIADLLNWNIYHAEERVDDSNTYNRHLYHKLSSAWIGYWVFKLIFMSLLLLFSLLSTAAIVYTIAEVYAGTEVTFKKVLKILPTVWKRLALTFLWSYFGFFVYNVVTGVVFMIWYTTTKGVFSEVRFWIIFVMYWIGLIYITVLWQLASVVTVLEGSSGIQAVLKSNALIKGKRWLSWFIFFVLFIIFVGDLFLFFAFMSYGFLTLIVGIVYVFILNVFLLGYVAQTMLYLVCKSYHSEPIDKAGLPSQLGGYLGEFEHSSKANNDIQLGQPQFKFDSLDCL